MLCLLQPQRAVVAVVRFAIRGVLEERESVATVEERTWWNWLFEEHFN